MASSPAISESYGFPWAPSPSPSTAQKHAHKIYPDFSPPLIAMVAVIGTAFLIVLYARVLSRHVRRLWRRCRLLISTSSSAGDGDLESPPPNSNSNGFSFDPSTDYFFSPYGLDDSTIRSLPISLFSSLIKSSLNTRDCAVCLLEFEHGDSLRTLPLCSHAFHVDCIDVWLRSHATCPLCRAGVFVPMRASRIRPSFDDIIFDPAPETDIQPAATSPPASRSMLLKRSYSFGFERNLAADRLVLEASTASPLRYRPRGSIWSKRWPSPFAGPSSASRGVRVFSFGSHRGFAVRSPFVKWRGFYPLSESGGVRSHGGSGPSARRSMAMTSPSAMFMRSMATAGFSSSRMRCGDPEALLSPERLDHRQ